MDQLAREFRGWQAESEK